LPDPLDDAIERRRAETAAQRAAAEEAKRWRGSVFSDNDPRLVPIAQSRLGRAAIDLLEEAVPRLPESRWLRAWCGTAPDGSTRLCFHVSSWWARLALTRIYVATLWDGIPSSEESSGEDWVRIVLTRDGRIDTDAFIRDVASLERACVKMIAG
jgi:hypothetical protein